MKTTVAELPDSKVRLEVEVPEADVQHALEHAASDLAGSMKIPGFRKGKVPTRVVAARVGRDALWQEAVRSHIESWFWNAALTSGIQPVAGPELEFGAAPENGTFRFTATVPVAPKPEVGDWTTLEVGAAEPDVPAELVDREIERIRETVAELAPVDGRSAREGDTVILDLVGEEIPTQRDYVVELGEGRLVDPLEEAVVGMTAGETKPVEIQVDETRTATVRLALKDVKEKVLPDVDDELARAATEFETIADLRADLELRLREQLAEELDAKFREDALDALVEISKIEHTEPLVERRAAQLWSGVQRSLQERGIPPDTYFTMTGQSQDDVLAALRRQAEEAVKRELVLDAVAANEGLEVSDEDIEAFVREQTAESGEDAGETLAALREQDTLEQLRGDLRLRKALDVIVSGVKRIPVDLARARDKLWTPEKEKAPTDTKIWTPGVKETA
jgi:trigger factor